MSISRYNEGLTSLESSQLRTRVLRVVDAIADRVAVFDSVQRSRSYNSDVA